MAPSDDDPPGSRVETLRRRLLYGAVMLPGALALVVLFVLIAGLILQVAQAIRLRRAART